MAAAAPNDIDLFYSVYGRALGQWSRVEHAVGRLLCRLTRMDQDIGLAVYFSVNSFHARSGLLFHALPAAKLPPFGEEFLRALISRLRLYSQTRNDLAHEIHASMLAGTSNTVEAVHVIATRDGKWYKLQNLRDILTAYSAIYRLIEMSTAECNVLREAELSHALLLLLPAHPYEPMANGDDFERRLAELAKHGE